MQPDELLSNLRDILMHYNFPFSKEDLAQALDFNLTGHILRDIQRTPGNFPTGSFVVRLLDECRFGDTHSPIHQRFPRFFSEATHLFTTTRNGRAVSYFPVFYFNAVNSSDLDVVLNPNSRILIIRGGTGYDWTDISLHGHLCKLHRSIELGPHVILAESTRRGHTLPLARKENAKEKSDSSDSKGTQREFKYGYDVYFVVHSTQSEEVWHEVREQVRRTISQRCSSGENNSWFNEHLHNSNVLTSCPALWRCDPQIIFEVYSMAFNFQSDTFLSTFCYPHSTRGDDREVTILSVAHIEPHDPNQNDTSTLEQLTADDLLELYQEQHCSISDFSMLYALYPTDKFSPSSCAYGNPELASNRKLRFVVLWKDGIRRHLPTTLRTASATYTLTAAEEPQHHLPGFWTMEQAGVRSKYYNGMLRAAYLAHHAHAQSTTIQNPLLLRGIQPSLRWYNYKAQSSYVAKTNNETIHRTLNFGERTIGNGRNTTPGRGQTRRSPAWERDGAVVNPRLNPTTPSTHSTAVASPSTMDIGKFLESYARSERIRESDHAEHVTMRDDLASLRSNVATLVALFTAAQNTPNK
jgi:hypothetical protein